MPSLYMQPYFTQHYTVVYIWNLQFPLRNTALYICKEIYINDRENVFLTIKNYICWLLNSSAFAICIPGKCFVFLSHIFRSY